MCTAQRKNQTRPFQAAANRKFRKWFQEDANTILRDRRRKNKMSHRRLGKLFSH